MLIIGCRGMQLHVAASQTILDKRRAIDEHFKSIIVAVLALGFAAVESTSRNAIIQN